MDTPSQVRDYEFTGVENETISKTGLYTRMWGVLTLASGVLMACAGAIALFSGEPWGWLVLAVYGLLALIPIYIGLFFMRAGSSLLAVVNTAGSDIGHLMRGLDSLRKAFLIQLVCVAVWIGLVVMAILGGIITMAR